MSARRRSLFDRFLSRIGLARTSAIERSYAGAAVSRLYNDWVFATLRSADQDVAMSLATLRARSREMARNTAFGKRYRELAAENVVGPYGMRLQSRVTGADGVAFDTDVNSRNEEAWRRWSAPETASVDGRLSFSAIERLAVESWVQDGEALLRMVGGYDNEFGFALQALDPDQLDHRFNRERRAGRNEIRGGIEVNDWGRPVAYWLWPDHPSEHARPSRDRLRISADEIIHFYLVERVGQTRGVPRFAPILLDSKMFAGLMEAELVASRVHASATGLFIENEEGVEDPSAPKTPAANAPLPAEAAPGTFFKVPYGYGFETFSPEHPTTAFAPFIKVIQRHIATGLGASYNLLFNDLEGVNYSSLRGGVLTERDIWRCMQELFRTAVHRRVYLAWHRWALLSGALELPLRNTARWTRHAWLPRGWQWVDPLKEVQAAEKSIGLLLDSRQRIAAAQGVDWEEVLVDLAREQELMRKYGVQPSATAAPLPGTFEGEDDEDEDAGDGKPRSAAPRDGDPGLAPGFLGEGIRRRNGNGRRADPGRDLVRVPR